MKKRLIGRVRAWLFAATDILLGDMPRGVLFAIGQVGGHSAQEKVLGERRDKLRTVTRDRAQWRRWYKANKKYQRQAKALARLTGKGIHPSASSLPRWAVR